MSHVLFVCIQNAGRSQIAQALFERAAGGRHQARSAGSRPAHHVHAEVAAVLREIGIDIAGNIPHKLDDDDMRWADLVVTMGCGDECPFISGKRYIDWELDDPSGRPADEVRRIRDRIGENVGALLSELATTEEVTP
jgi:arsenate reductase